MIRILWCAPNYLIFDLSVLQCKILHVINSRSDNEETNLLAYLDNHPVQIRIRYDKKPELNFLIYFITLLLLDHNHLTTELNVWMSTRPFIFLSLLHVDTV